MESLGWTRQSLTDVLRKFTSISRNLVQVLALREQPLVGNRPGRRLRTTSLNNNTGSTTCHDRDCQESLNNNNNENQRNYQNRNVITTYNANNNNGQRAPGEDGVGGSIYDILGIDLNRTRTMNAFVLSSVFFLGVISAAFFTILWSIRNGGGGDRKTTFQPLPHVVDLQIVDEGFFDPLSPLSREHPLKEEENECDPDNPLGKKENIQP